MNTKHLCVGILSLLIALQANAFSQLNETISREPSGFKNTLKKVASLAVIDKTDPDARARRHGAGGAAFGVFLGHALVWGSCHTVAAVASFFGTPVAGVVVETGISVGSPFIEAVALKASLGLGIIFGVATGPV